MATPAKRFLVDVTLSMFVSARTPRDARIVGHARMLALLGVKSCGTTCPVRRVSAVEYHHAPRRRR